MLVEHELEKILSAGHGDPFSVLGLHEDAQQRFWLRAFLPGATQLTVLDARSGESLGVLDPRHPDGFFEGLLPVVARPDYLVGVPSAGVCRERINTDSSLYGGSNVGAPFGEFAARFFGSHGKPCSIELYLPPLATVILECKA